MQDTANTMALVSEALGLALPGSAMLPAVYAQRQVIAEQAGETVMAILRHGGPLPRDLVTRHSCCQRRLRYRRGAGDSARSPRWRISPRRVPDGAWADPGRVGGCGSGSRRQVRVDAAVGAMNVVLSDQELAARRAQWRPAAAPSLGGTLEKYAAVVGPAHLGAVTHSGKVNWPYLLPP